MIRSSCIYISLHVHSDADLYAEDHNSHTPILTSAVQKQVTAFQHFMKYVDLKDSERNPIFKTLCVKWKQTEILEVCLILFLILLTLN